METLLLNDCAGKGCLNCGKWFVTSEYLVGKRRNPLSYCARCRHLNVLRHRGCKASLGDFDRRDATTECDLCGGPPGPRGWYIDHCHVSGRVRGFLCSRCNTGLGMFLDDPVLMRAAAEYVEKHSE